jgi:hypothetical protein
MGYLLRRRNSEDAGREGLTGDATRPYRFGQFDLLAVSMAPLLGDGVTSGIRCALAGTRSEKPITHFLVPAGSTI